MKYEKKWVDLVEWLEKEKGFDMDWLYAEVLPSWWTMEWIATPDGFIDTLEIINKVTHVSLEEMKRVVFSNE